MRFILFYSSKECPTSVNIVNYMRNNGILQNFYKYDVWDFEVDQLVSLNIKIFPAIVIVSPNGNYQRHEGKNAFEWLQWFITNNRRQSMAQLANSNRHKYLEMNLSNTKGGVSDFCKGEMEGKSDEYAYLLTDMPQSKSYVGLGMDEQAIVTYEKSGKITASETNRMMDQAKRNLKAESEALKAEMKEKQLEALYNARVGM